MSNSFDTTSRLVQWRINYFPPSKDIESHSFKMGNSIWYFALRNSLNVFDITLKPTVAQDSTLIASLNMRVVSLPGGKTLMDKKYKDALVKTNMVFKWELKGSTGRFIIDIEFLDLKIGSSNGGEARSIWGADFTQKDTYSTSLNSFGRMLTESIHTDIIICASDGSIGAHRAVLAARSPVFNSMFTHDFKEKEMSTINISDMSIEACKAFLNYLYSNLQYEDFFNHRLDLLKAADKYDIADLKDACHKSLMEDIDTENVLDILQMASMYHLPMLKASCLKYLVKFGKIYDIQKEFEAFIQSADRELIAEVFKEILSIRKVLEC